MTSDQKFITFLVLGIFAYACGAPVWAIIGAGLLYAIGGS